MNLEEPSTNPKFNTEGGVFMGAKRNLDSTEGASVAIYGVPYDGTSSFRSGARFGPSAIREVSACLETYCPQLSADLELINFLDLGSLEIPYGSPEPVIQLVKNATKSLFSRGLKPLLLGGEHSITVGAVEAIAEDQPDLVLVQLDAHADLRDQWLGSSNNHACAMRRCLDVLNNEKLIQVGIRSGSKKEFEELKQTKRLITHIPGRPPINLANALKKHIGDPIYLTIDLDWFDPSLLPGTGTPEPGGFFWQDFSAIIEVLKEHRIVAADVMELAPHLDPSNTSSIVAAKVARSLLILLNQSN